MTDADATGVSTALVDGRRREAMPMPPLRSALQRSAILAARVSRAEELPKITFDIEEFDHV